MQLIPFPARLSRTFSGLAASALLLLPLLPAHSGTMISHDAGLALSPYSETGARLKLKDISIRAEVRNGFAQTTLTTVFSNTIESQCQASLDLTVPHDSVVTGYAYWFKGERIQAKLLDNDKAWEIYSTITSHHRDPAIMEQWYDTTYHLQIYPVEPQKDLRVEVSYVSPLESDASGFYYRLPLATGENAPTLQRFSAQVTVKGLAGRTFASEAMGSNRTRSDTTYSATRENWKPDRDWLVRIRPRNPRMESHGTAVATNRGKGYFSVVLWTARPLNNPKVRLASSGVRSVHTPGLARVVPAGKRLLIEGRYTRPGRLRLGISDARMRTVWATLTLPRRSGQIVPKKLWAAAEIKHLSGALGHWEQRPQLAGAKRRKVIDMSLAYGVMSPYTAWLAVPKAEFAFYKQVKAQQASQPSVQTNTWTARGGDPLIRVVAEPDTVRVTAFLPTGEPVAMVPLPHHVWEGRFDMPAETAEGTYRVVVLIQRADGGTRRITLTYRIDRRGPAGLARATEHDGTVDVTVDAGSDTAAAYLVLPDGRRVRMDQAGSAGPFSAHCSSTDLGSGTAEIILLDGAHNVTRLSLDPQ